MKNIPLVSVIIPSRNSEKTLGICLKSIKNQNYPQNKIEIIVVDNNSTDKTKKIAKKYTKKVFNKGPERSAQRNFGIKKAMGEYILYLDADMSLSEKVVEECINKFVKSKSEKFIKKNPLSTLKTFNFTNSNLVGLYIPERIIGDSYWCKVRDLERSFYDGTVIDCVRFFPKKIWEKVGGFDESLTGPEDWDFDKKVRMRGKVDIINSRLYHHESDFTLEEYLRGKSYYTQSFDKYIKKWGKDDPDIKKQFGFWYRYFGVFIEKGKWIKLVSHPLLALRMYCLRFLVGIKYLNDQKIIRKDTEEI